MSSDELRDFNELDIEVKSEVLSSEQDSMQQITLKVFVFNKSNHEITKLQILITSLPTGVELMSEKKSTLPKLIPNSSKVANFNIDVSQHRNGGFIESVVTYNDPNEIMHSIPIERVKINSNLNFLL